MIHITYADVNCAPGDTLIMDFVDYFLDSYACLAPPVSLADADAPPRARSGASIPGGSYFTNGSMGRIGTFFRADTCGRHCVFSALVPDFVNPPPPVGPPDAFYIRVVNADGTPGGGEYTVCLFPQGTPPPVLYHYTSDGWMPAPPATSPGPNCFLANGEGVFYIDWDGTHSPQDQQPPAAPSLDVNGDGVISPGDVLRLIHYINSFDPPPYDPAYDLNQDGRVTQQDVLLILYYLRSLAPDGAP